MPDAILRQWTLLKAIPLAPKKRDTRALQHHLEAAGYETSLRSVQRDLVALSSVFPLVNDESPTAYGWSWSKDADVFDLPAMDTNLALVLKLVELHAPQVLPPQLASFLRPHFQRAGRVLADASGRRLGEWLDRIRVIPAGMPLQPPQVLDADAAAVVYEAVLRRRRFSASYRSRSAGTDVPASFEVNPLGLVVRGPVVYLVCTIFAYSDVRHLALHRFVRAELLDAEAMPPQGFDLDAHLRSGAFEIAYGPSIRLRLRVNRSVAEHLEESPMAADQQVSAEGDGQAIVTASVPDSGQLRWWLMGFGDLVEVLEPGALRAELVAAFEAAASRYRASGSDRG
jgi:predicted DNA-binding transcriptional regulator YafY